MLVVMFLNVPVTRPSYITRAYIVYAPKNVVTQTEKSQRLDNIQAVCQKLTGELNCSWPPTNCSNGGRLKLYFHSCIAGNKALVSEVLISGRQGPTAIRLLFSKSHTISTPQFPLVPEAGYLLQTYLQLADQVCDDNNYISNAFCAPCLLLCIVCGPIGGDKSSTALW
jgi:hypothetical protein